MTDLHELTISPFIDAPPAAVCHAMVDRQAEWGCPKPWRAEFTTRETRPGGGCDVVMPGPDGEEHSHGGIYLAFDKGKRFVTADAIQGDFEPHGPS